MEADDRAKVTLLFAALAWKLLPVMVTLAPAAAIVGLTDEIVGAGIAAATLKLAVLVTVVPATVILMGPEVAPAGTITMMLLAVDDTTVQRTPLIQTWLLEAVVENPLP